MADFDPFAQLALLDLQTTDHAIDRARNRLATLPERETAAAGERLVEACQSELNRLIVEAADLELDVEKAEGDVQTVRLREDRDRSLVDGGSINDGKQLTELQHELETLLRRRGELEEVELEVLERLENVKSDILTARESVEKASIEATRLAEIATALIAEIEVEISALEVERQTKSAKIPADLLGLYEKIRLDNAGTGAALLRQGKCTGCGLQMSAAGISVARQAKPQALLRCDECRAILVRTDESGL